MTNEQLVDTLQWLRGAFPNLGKRLDGSAILLEEWSKVVRSRTVDVVEEAARQWMWAHEREPTLSQFHDALQIEQHRRAKQNQPEPEDLAERQRQCNHRYIANWDDCMDGHIHQCIHCKMTWSVEEWAMAGISVKAV